MRGGLVGRGGVDILVGVFLALGFVLTVISLLFFPCRDSRSIDRGLHAEDDDDSLVEDVPSGLFVVDDIYEKQLARKLEIMEYSIARA